MHTIDISKRIIAGMLALILSAGFARAGEPRALTTYPSTAYRLAVEYLKTKPKIEAKTPEELAGSDSFADFMSGKGMKAGGRMAVATAELVVVAVDAANEQGIEIDLGKEGFRLLLEEAAARRLQVAPVLLGGGTSPADTGGGQARPKEKDDTEKKDDEKKDPATKEEVENILQKTIEKVLSKDTKADFKNIQSYFHTGVTLLNPYRIDTTTAPLTVSPATSTDINAYLEFVYNNRWAWNEARIESQFGECETDFVKWPGVGEWDIQTRLGYTFASNDAPTANTLVGSGNFNAEISVGLPFVISRAPNGQSAVSVGLEAGYGAVTERATLRAHPNAFVGLACTTSFLDPFGSKDVIGDRRRVLVYFRLGQGSVESVHYVSDADTEIHSINGNMPRYFRDDTLALEAQLLYPVKTSTFVTFGGRVYPDLNPGLWSMQIGVTTSFADLLDGFFK